MLSDAAIRTIGDRADRERGLPGSARAVMMSRDAQASNVLILLSDRAELVKEIGRLRPYETAVRLYVKATWGQYTDGEQDERLCRYEDSLIATDDMKRLVEAQPDAQR